MTIERKGRRAALLKLYSENLAEGTYRENAEMPGESMTIRRAYANPDRRR
jgi:hypothetical protein